MRHAKRIVATGILALIGCAAPKAQPQPIVPSAPGPQPEFAWHFSFVTTDAGVPAPLNPRLLDSDLRVFGLDTAHIVATGATASLLGTAVLRSMDAAHVTRTDTISVSGGVNGDSVDLVLNPEVDHGRVVLRGKRSGNRIVGAWYMAAYSQGPSGTFQLVPK